MRKRGWWLGFLCLTAGLWMVLEAGVSQELDPRRVLQQAFENHQAGNYQKAVEGYEQFVKFYPEVADVYSNLGAAYVQIGKVGNAIEAYEKAIEIGNGTDPVAIRFNLALAYYKMARLSEAMENLKQVLAENPDHLNAALLLADCHLRRDNQEEVIKILTPFEASHPQNRGLSYLLGTALIRTGNVEKGQVLVDRILSDGESAEAHLMLGTAFLQARDIPGATQEFEKAVALNPSLPSANSFLAKALREMGRVDESIPYFRKELEVNPLDFDSHLYLGVFLYKREQRYEEALEHFRTALDIRPGALEARFQIALIYILQDRADEALKIVEEVVAEAPDFLEGHVTLTRLYYRMRRREEAEKHREIVERLRAEKDAETVKQVGPDGTAIDAAQTPPGK